MTKKLFIFDLDGTLINAYPAIVESMNYTLRRMNHPEAEPERIIRSVGMGNDGLFKKFFSDREVPEARQIYREHHRVNLSGKISLLPGALALLRNLKAKGKLLAVASNRPAETASLLIKILEIEVYFDRVLTGEEVSQPKPAPDILIALLDYFQVSREEAVYVGDMDIDAETGAAAGVKTVIVVTGSSTREEIEAVKPGLIIDSLEDFPEDWY
ncbi:MAG: HAD family hydrolase [Candidatus Omnitrophota bacterium]|nr:HAD family hydrolase [Candidatus Omnitrophota bacterium]